MNKKILAFFLLLFIKCLVFSYEIKKYPLNLQSINLNDFRKFSMFEDISLVKSLVNNDIVISISSNNGCYNYYLINSLNSEELTYLFYGYDGKFHVEDNKILSLNEEGFIYSFDPYKKTLDIKEKPQKLFFPHEDGNDKRRRKYQFSGHDKTILIDRYKDDFSFEYILYNLKLPHGCYIQSITNGRTKEDIFILFEKEEKEFILNYNLKTKKMINVIPLSNIINDSGYNISSSPDGHWLLLYSTHSDQNEFLFYNLDTDRLYQSDYILEKDIRFQDWDFDSKYVIFSSNSNKSIYRIYLPSL